MKTKLPKRVKVISGDYKVRRVSKQWIKDSESRGQCDTEEYLITIPRGSNLSLIVDTTVHEIFHAVYDIMQLTDDDKEEDYVSRMATGWVSVMRDNPALRRWFFDALDALDGPVD